MNTRRRRSPLPARAVAAAGAAMAALVLAGSVGFTLFDRADMLKEQQQRGELLARVLEDHATRSVETASLALGALADTLARDPAGRVAADGAALTQAIAAQPLLRGLAVVDSAGTVLAATTPGDAGMRIELARLGPLPPPGTDRVGQFVPGRGLAALAPGAATTAPPGVGFVPLLRPLAVGGRPVLLLALINPDAIANHQQQTLDDPHSKALLAGFDGRVLAATGNVPLAPGSDLRQLPPFTQYLPRIEHASYRGDGLAPGRQIVSFRASRTRPLVVWVEHPEAESLVEWWAGARWILAGGTGTTLVIAAMTLLAVRSVQTREKARRQRDQALAAAVQREAELSVIVKSVQELIFRTDAAGTLTFANARWKAATGRGAAELAGASLASLVHPDSQAALKALFAPGSGPRAAQVLIGTRRFDLALSPLLEGERTVGFAGSAVDITERHAAEERLKAQNAFSELLVDTMPVPVSLLDADGRYVSVNRAWEAFTGRWREAVIGTRARDYLPPEEAALHDEQDRRLLAEGGVLRYETGFTHRDGSRRTLALTKAAVPGTDGRPTGVLVCLMDISELREAERAIREARDAAEEASRAKSEFIANISHELRTPLQSIIGFSELGMVRGRQHEKLASMFTDIHASGRRMLALVNDLLDVAKIESTVGTFHLERTDVRPLVRDVLNELTPLLGARRLHVEADLGNVPLVAKVDPMRFQQVVRNVLANAVKFSPEGSAIDVSGELTAGSRIVLAVRDRGPGIPPAEVEKIFEAFVQSSKTKDGSGGTGLGLAICRKIVEAHGGSIRAENMMAGGGSRFTIELPARGFTDTVV